MKITHSKEYSYSDTATQKEIAQFLKTHFCIPTALFNKLLKKTREERHCWFSIKTCGNVICIDAAPRKMSLFWCKADEWQNVITAEI